MAPLTTPYPVQTVDNPDLSYQANIDGTMQTNAAVPATFTIDPSLGALVTCSGSVVAVTLALIGTQSGVAVKAGQNLTLLYTPSGVSPTIAAGTGFKIKGGTLTLIQTKVNVLRFVYDGTNFYLVSQLDMA